MEESRWMTGRGAAAFLEQTTGMTTRSARRVLECGLVGRPEVVGRAHLYDRDRVARVARWPVLSRAALDRCCPWGAFVARRDLDLAAAPESRLATLCGGWDFSVWVAVWLRAMADQHGFVPLVATVSGFVADGADITGVRTGSAEGRFLLVLRPAGPWFTQVARRQLPTGPGRPWSVLGVPWKRPPAPVPPHPVGESGT